MFSLYDPFTIRPQIISIVITAIIIITISVFYWRSTRNLKYNEAPKGIALVMEMFVKVVRNLVVDSLGKKYEKLTPYIMYLLMYIGIGNLLSIVGFEPPATSLTVTLSLGLVTWIGMFVIGIKVQRMAILNMLTIAPNIIGVPSKKHGKIGIIPNPLKGLEFVSKLLSISMRLWGNITAGSIVLGLVYTFTGFLSSYIPYLGQLNMLGVMVTPWLHLYFDVLSGLVQAYVFTFLTLTFWEEMKEEEHTLNKNEDIVPQKHAERLETLHAN